MTPLDGILVADFSRVLAGPLATMTLADLGATVVKVERPGEGDETRAWGPPWTTTSSSYFDCVNRGKLGIALDLADEADRAEAVELARRADVVVHNLRGLDRYGLGYDAVSAANPRVVYCSITGFGPASDRPGYDFLVQAMGGLMSITGEPGGEPRKVGVAVVDVLTGKDAVIGILAALRARARTGAGDHVQVDLLSSLLGGLVNQGAGYLATGVPPGRMGNQHPSIAPYETLRCADGLVAVACGNDGQFRRMAAALDRPALADDARFATNPDRVVNRPALVALLEDALAGDTAAGWEQRLATAGVPAALVGDIGSAFAHAADYGLEPTVEVGTGRQVRHPVRYRANDVATPSAPPALGEHTELVREWLAGPGDVALPRH
ncbi:MAG: CaiB/BaiF CoA transferase family protein [Jatrophihabitans sp.]|uniref:CaiB/BaiF CoA transferase family protein n=1 Tax=Jatrophihabitans sp. TaxID=1932789 RepID=UPI00391673C4